MPRKSTPGSRKQRSSDQGPVPLTVAADQRHFWASLARTLNHHGPVLVLAVWAILYLPRPFMLGFYSDDWSSLVEPIHGTTPFSLDRLGQFVGIHTGYGSRPVLGMFAFLLSSVFGSSAMAYQWAAIVLVLIAALSLRAWLNGLLAAFSEYHSLVADWAVIFWLVMPWMLAVTAWPVMSHTLLAQILFTEAARMLMFPGPLSAKFAVRFGLLLMASALTYEAFYFQIFLVIALWAISGVGGGHDKRKMFMFLSIACIAQATPILLNRYAAQIGANTSKTLSKQWQSILLLNIRHFPAVLEASLLDRRSLWAGSVVLLLACAVCLAVVGITSQRQRPLIKMILLIALLAVTSFCISTSIYSLAGYGFTYTGVESRTLFSASWSLSIAFFGLLACFFIRANVVLRGGLLLSAIGVVVLAAYAQHTTLQDWAHVWQQERTIVAAAPVAEISQLPPDSSILYIGPSYYKSIVIFGASWDLTHAVFARKPLSDKRKPHQGLITIYPATELYKWSWDGSYLIQNLPGYWTQTFPAAHLYVWEYAKSRIDGLKPGFKWPPS